MEHLERFKKDVAGKTVGVVGIGVSNTPIITMLAEMGVKVIAFDKRPEEQLGDPGKDLKKLGVEMVCGEDYMEHLAGDWIIKTPGMRYDHPALLKAKEKGSVITSEMELFFEYCPCPIVAVTGSDGKTTTTRLFGADHCRGSGGGRAVQLSAAYSEKEFPYQRCDQSFSQPPGCA